VFGVRSLVREPHGKEAESSAQERELQAITMERKGITLASPDLDGRARGLGKFVLALILAITVLQGCAVGPPPSSGGETSPKVAEIFNTIASQQGEDPLIGLWNATSGGFSWSVAIIKDQDVSKGYTLKGLMIKPLPSFAEGEEVLYLKRSSVAGVYEGTQKWKDGLGLSSWVAVRVVSQGENIFTQYNSLRGRTFISATWGYLREVISGPEATRKAERGGTGFVVRGSPLVLTSNHVVQGAKDIRVIFRGQEHPVKLYRQDPQNDLVLLLVIDFTLQPEDGLPVDLSLGVHPGESIFVIGYPLGEKLGEEASIVGGLVNATVGPNDDPRLFRISAPLNPGNSGGPILNQRGQVVGIAVSVLRGRLVEGIGFGIKIGAATEIARDLAPASGLGSAEPISPERIYERVAPWVVRIVSR
jgi:S1-C subfamily serine protease